MVILSALSTVHLYPPSPQEIFLALISVRGWAYPRVIVQQEGLNQWRILMTPQGIEPHTFSNLPTCSAVPQMLHRVLLIEKKGTFTIMMYDVIMLSVLFTYKTKTSLYWSTAVSCEVASPLEIMCCLFWCCICVFSELYQATSAR